MKFTSFIDNVNAKEWGLTILQAYLFDWVFTLPSWADKNIIDGNIYYFASRSKVIEDLPLLTDKSDTVYRYYKQLEDAGLITLIKVGRRDYISLSEKAKTWGRKLGNFSDTIKSTSENNPSFGGQNPENNPTDKSIILDKSIKIDERRQKFVEEISKFKDKYGPVTLNGFFNYWSEMNQEQNAMRFEKEKFFQVSKRLVTWKRNERPSGGNFLTGMQPVVPGPSPFDNVDRLNQDPQ